MAEQLSDLTWALLCIFHRHVHGGPKPPTEFAFADALRELEAQGLVAEGRITEQGEAVVSDMEIESRLELARRHVVESEQRVAEQEKHIEWLRSQGRDVGESEELLATFRTCLSIMRSNLAVAEGEERESRP